MADSVKITPFWHLHNLSASCRASTRPDRTYVSRWYRYGPGMARVMQSLMLAMWHLNVPSMTNQHRSFRHWNVPENCTIRKAVNLTLSPPTGRITAPALFLQFLFHHHSTIIKPLFPKDLPPPIINMQPTTTLVLTLTAMSCLVLAILQTGLQGHGKSPPGASNPMHGGGGGSPPPGVRL
jgi:hypothetical protein